MRVRWSFILLLVCIVIASSSTKSTNKKRNKSTKAFHAKARPAPQERGHIQKRGGNKKKNGQTQKNKKYLFRQDTRTPFKANSCEYLDLSSIVNNAGCENGDKFVIQKVKGVRKQFFIMNGKATVGFVKRKTKYSDCTSAVNITSQVTCKEVSGLSSLDLVALSGGDTTDTTEEDFTKSLKTCHTTKKPVVSSEQKTAMESLDVAAVKADLTTLMTDSQEFWPADYGNYGPLLIRLAWHSAGSYRSSDGRGGSDGGRMRFDPEQSWEDNTNLDEARKLLEPIKEKYGIGLTWGDLFILAGNVAIESMGGPILGFCGGRIDDLDGTESTLLGPTVEQVEQFPCPDEGDCQSPLGTGQIQLIYVNPGGPQGRPDPLESSGNIRDVFGRMGMNDSETVALIGGGHAFGKNHGACNVGANTLHFLPPNYVDEHEHEHKGGAQTKFNPVCGTGKGGDTYTSGFEFAWTTMPTRWDNEYFQNLVTYDHNKAKGTGGKWEWQSTTTKLQADNAHGEGKQDIKMLTTDVALKNDDKYLELVKKWAENKDSLDHAFKHAWYKLTSRDMGPRSRCMGNDVPAAQPFQFPLPEPSTNLTDVNTVKADIVKLLEAEDDNMVGLLIRLSWQCSATYRATDYVGGCNGARIRMSPQKDWAVNAGLETALSKLESIKNTHGDGLSWADLIILAGYVAIEKTGGISMTFCPGRTDVSGDDGLSEVLNPEASQVKNFTKLCSFIDHMDITNEEYAVLYAAAYTIGQVGDGKDTGMFGQRDASKTDGTLSNAMFTTLAGADFHDDSEMDLIFGHNKELNAIAQIYAKDNALFLQDFASAWTKVSNLGSFDGPFGSMCDSKSIFQ